MKAKPPHKLVSQTTKEEERFYLNGCNQMMDRKQLKEEFLLAGGARKYSLRAGEEQ